MQKNMALPYVHFSSITPHRTTLIFYQKVLKKEAELTKVFDKGSQPLYLIQSLVYPPRHCGAVSFLQGGPAASLSTYIGAEGTKELGITLLLMGTKTVNLFAKMAQYKAFVGGLVVLVKHRRTYDTPTIDQSH